MVFAKQYGGSGWDWLSLFTYSFSNLKYVDGLAVSAKHDLIVSALMFGSGTTIPGVPNASGYFQLTVTAMSAINGTIFKYFPDFAADDGGGPAGLLYLPQ